MPDDFGYINARLRGMRSRLVTQKLDEALAASSYGEFLRVLAESPLGSDLGEATAQQAGLFELDRAVSRNFTATAQRILSFADGEAGFEIRVLLSRYDLANLKTIARGKISGREASEIEANLLPAGMIRPSLLTQLANAPDLTAAASLLSIANYPLALSFRHAVASYAASNDALAFEVELDRAHFEAALDHSKSETLHAYLRHEIDGINLLTALKLRAQGRHEGIERYFVPGGREVNLSRFVEITRGEGGLEGLAFFHGLDGSLAQAEGLVRTRLLEEAHRLYTADALGIGLAIGFIREKEQEIALIRLLARGKFYGVPVEILRKEVGGGL